MEMGKKTDYQNRIVYSSKLNKIGLYIGKDKISKNQ